MSGNRANEMNSPWLDRREFVQAVGAAGILGAFAGVPAAASGQATPFRAA